MFSSLKTSDNVTIYISNLLLRVAGEFLEFQRKSVMCVSVWKCIISFLISYTLDRYN